MQKYLEIGKIINTHGVRGEVKLDPWCDAREVLSSLRTVYIDARPVGLAAFRMHQRFALLTLEGVRSLDDAQTLKNRVICALRDDISLPDGHFFYSDLFGFDVFDSRTGRIIGTLTDVREMPGSDLYVVTSGGQEILIPAVEEFEEDVDFDARRLTLRTIEGMLPDEN